MVGGRVINQVEVHACAKGWCLHLFERDFLHVHVDFGRGSVRDELLDDVVLAVRVEDAVGQLAVKEVEGLRKVILNRVAVAAVIQGAKLGEKVLRFGVLGFVLEVVIVDGFGAAEVVNGDNQRAKVLEGANSPEIDEGQSHTNNGQQSESNLEIGIRHHGITTRFEIEAFGIVETCVLVHPKTLSDRK